MAKNIIILIDKTSWGTSAAENLSSERVNTTDQEKQLTTSDILYKQSLILFVGPFKTGGKTLIMDPWKQH